MIERFKALIRLLAWPAVAVAPSLVAMRGMFSTSSVYAFRECALIFFPTHRWVRNTIAGGDAPLWDPYLALGQSGVAEPWRHVLFPPAVVLRLLPSETLSFNLWIGLPFPVAALGVYMLVRTRATRSAAAIGAIVFSVSSTMLSTGNMPNLAWSMALAPWSIWAVAMAARRRRMDAFAIACAVVGLQALAGEPVTFAASMMLAFAYALATEELSIREARATVLWTVATMVVGFLLGAIQYGPLLEAVRGSSRAAAQAANLSWSLHPLRLLELAAPFPFTNAIATPPEYDAWQGLLSDGREPLLISHYLGMPALTLAAIGAVWGRRRDAILWSVVAIVGVVCALGAHTAAYPLAIRVIPAIALFRFPEKYMLLVVLALALLAASGWDALVDGRVRRAGVRGAYAAVAAILVVLAGVASAAPLLASMVGASGGAAEFTRHALWGAAPTLIGLAIGTVGVVAWLTSDGSRSRHAVALGVVLVSMDLLAAGAWLNPQISASYFREPAWIARAASTNNRACSGVYLANYLVRRLGWSPSAVDEDADALNPAVMIPSGDSYIAGSARAGLLSGMYESQWGLRGVFTVDAPRLLPNEYHAFEEMYFTSTANRRARALDRIGVRSQMRRGPPVGDEYTETEDVPNIGFAKAYFSDAPFDRIFVAPHTTLQPSSPAAIQSLFDADFSPRDEALVATPSLAAGVASAARPSDVRVLEDRPNRIRIRAGASDGATLVVLESFNPGWSATVDGNAAEVVRVDGLFLGVRLAPGDHDVVLRFLPRSLTFGALVTFATSVVLIVCAAVSLRRRRRISVTDRRRRDEAVA